jgi:hypothetical protein
VPSFQHEILVELFRNRAELACELLRTCAGIDFEGHSVETGSIDLSQITPAEYRSDTVAIVRDMARIAIAAVIVEIQLGIDPDKLRTWPVYVTALRARLGCPVTLLVIAPDPATARWACRAIEVGHPGFRLQPVVIGYDDIPLVTDPSMAADVPELAVLSVLAHPVLAVAEAAIAAVARLPEDRARLYWDVVMAALPDQLRRILLEAHVKNYEYQTDFARKFVAQGRQEGRQEGRREGRDDGLRAALLELARAKLGSLSDEDEIRIHQVAGASLTGLIVALGQALDAATARMIVDRIEPAAT